MITIESDKQRSFHLALQGFGFSENMKTWKHENITSAYFSMFEQILVIFATLCNGIQRIIAQWVTTAVASVLALRSQNTRYLKFKKAATCSHSSGRKWPQVAARASGRTWPQVAARGRTLDLKFLKQRHLHHLQPLAATCRNLQPANGC
jgi:hypothetical protein